MTVIALLLLACAHHTPPPLVGLYECQRMYSESVRGRPAAVWVCTDDAGAWWVERTTPGTLSRRVVDRCDPDAEGLCLAELADAQRRAR